jgi:hypothetical protein
LEETGSLLRLAAVDVFCLFGRLSPRGRMFDRNLVVRLPLTAANHGHRSFRLKARPDFSERVNQPAHDVIWKEFHMGCPVAPVSSHQTWAANRNSLFP